MSNLNLPDLYEIFQPKEEYCFKPNWEEALQRCSKTLEKLDEIGEYRCMEVSPNPFDKTTCSSTEEAMKTFFKEKNGRHASVHSYENNAGFFCIAKPLNILAVIPGTTTFLGHKRACSYIIYKGDGDWYKKALRIVKETIEFVLKQEDKDKYYLHWSS